MFCWYDPDLWLAFCLALTKDFIKYKGKYGFCSINRCCSAVTLIKRLVEVAIQIIKPAEMGMGFGCIINKFLKPSLTCSFSLSLGFLSLSHGRQKSWKVMWTSVWITQEAGLWNGPQALHRGPSFSWPVLHGRFHRAMSTGDRKHQNWEPSLQNCLIFATGKLISQWHTV